MKNERLAEGSGQITRVAVLPQRFSPNQYGSMICSVQE